MRLCPPWPEVCFRQRSAQGMGETRRHDAAMDTQLTRQYAHTISLSSPHRAQSQHAPHTQCHARATGKHGTQARLDALTQHTEERTRTRT